MKWTCSGVVPAGMLHCKDRDCYCRVAVIHTCTSLLHIGVHCPNICGGYIHSEVRLLMALVMVEWFFSFSPTRHFALISGPISHRASSMDKSAGSWMVIESLITRNGAVCQRIGGPCSWLQNDVCDLHEVCAVPCTETLFLNSAPASHHPTVSTPAYWPA